MGVLAVGTVRLSSTQISPFQWNKDFEKKNSRGALDYWVDHKSGVVVVKWIDKKVVAFALSFAGVDPMSAVKRWDTVTP